MGDEVNNSFTEGQKNAIYKEMLVPLKLKISQILLYDTDAALEFLQQYNEIVKNEESLGDQIIEKIVELEFKMQNYMSSDGKEKMYDEQSNTLIQQIGDLQVHYKQLSLEDFEKQLEEIKNLCYSNSHNYTFEKRDDIERKINSLQASLIMKKLNSGILYDVKEMISKDNKEGLTMYIYGELSKFMQSGEPTVQNVVNQLKSMIASGEDFVYNSKTWRLLDSAQRNTIITNPKQVENKVNLPAVQTKKAYVSFWDKLFGAKIKVGDRKMKIKKTVQLGTEEIKTKELSKIDMTWLASNISSQMLEELEECRLIKEGKTAVEKYTPDARTPIYEFMSEERKFNDNIVFYNEEGIELNLVSRRVGMGMWYVYICVDEEFKLKNNIHPDTGENVNNIIEYAKFIDSIIGSNLSQDLANELGVYFEKRALNGIYMDDETLMKKLPVYSNLLKSYQKIAEKYKETKINFKAKEDASRDVFYQQNRFRNNIRVKEKNDVNLQNDTKVENQPDIPNEDREQE